jgi:hypothetical protein
MKNSTIIIIVLVVISIFVIFGISLGVGLYLYFKKKKKNKAPYGLFGIKLSTPIPFPTGGWKNDPTNTFVGAVSDYVNAIKQKYGVTSLATSDQINTGVNTYGFNDCTLYCTDDTITESGTDVSKAQLVILPYWTSSSSPSTQDLSNCFGTKDNVGKHTVVNVSLNSGDSIEGFLVYSENPPDLGSKDVINGQQVIISGIYTL